MFLIDTSVWIEVFKKSRPIVLDEAVAFDEIVTCLPVVQEVLQGFKTESAFRTARESMLSFPMIESPLTVDVILEAIQLFREAKRRGLSIRSSVDCLIAACAIRHDLTVIHRDRDFSQIARISQLKEKRLK